MPPDSPLKVLLVASEAAPLAKTGGLADVVGSLPKALSQRGHDVRIIMPRYRGISAEAEVRELNLQVPIRVQGRVEQAVLYQADVGGIPVYLVGNDHYFDREFLYGPSVGDYPDNHRRYAFFCTAVVEFLDKIPFIPQIVHCHDWQTALLPVLLHHAPHAYPALSDALTIFTIHNLAYQGIFPPGSVTDMGLPTRFFSVETLEFYGNVNLMKGGIVAADHITTVSETYRNEILGPEHGCGLEGVLRGRADHLTGILNGIDYEEWNPATDRNIFENYTADDPGGKETNKEELQKTLGLEVNPGLPVIGMVSRMVAQKGFDLMAQILSRLAEMPLQLVILGVGEERYVKMLQEAKERNPGKISVNIGFAGWLAPRIYAGSDIFLMPSHFEPCGLGQLIALRYGTVPVVRRTGGLADTITDCTDDLRKGTGFLFTEYDPEALYDCIMRAVNAFSRRDAWHEIMRRGMAQDFSWTRSALRYEQLYERTLAEKRVRNDGK